MALEAINHDKSYASDDEIARTEIIGNIEQDFLDDDFVEKAKMTYNVDQFTDDFEVTLADGEYFVMGDNRLRSTDSRELGPFRLDDIVGMKGLVIYPFSDIQWID